MQRWILKSPNQTETITATLETEDKVEVAFTEEEVMVGLVEIEMHRISHALGVRNLDTMLRTARIDYLSYKKHKRMITVTHKKLRNL